MSFTISRGCLARKVYLVTALLPEDLGIAQQCSKDRLSLPLLPTHPPFTMVRPQCPSGIDAGRVVLQHLDEMPISDDGEGESPPFNCLVFLMHHDHYMQTMALHVTKATSIQE